MKGSEKSIGLLQGKSNFIQSFEMNCKVCQNLSVNNPSLSFFRFPADYNRCRDWAKRCSILPIFDKYGPGKFYKSFRICSEHFESKYVVFDGRKKKLLSCAVPKEYHRKEALRGIADDSKNKNLQPKLNCFTSKPLRNLCRFCAEEGTKLIDIFSWKGKTLKLEEKIKVFPLPVDKEDELPLKICRWCIIKINKFYEFVSNCMRADAKLKKILELNERKIFGKDGKSRNKTKLADSKKIDKGKPVLQQGSNAAVSDTTQNQDKYLSGKEYKKPELLKNTLLRLRVSPQKQQNPNQIQGINEPQKYQSNIEDLSTSYSGENEVSDIQEVYSSKESTEDKNSSNVHHQECEILNVQKYTCSKCFKNFSNSEILKSHEKAHSIEPDEHGRFICQTCGKVFPNKYRLNEHNRVHTGECPFKCPVCNKRFHKRALLRQHSTVHESGKRFVCSICNLRSNRKGNLIQHLKNHYKKLQNENSLKVNRQTYLVTGERTEYKRRRLLTESRNTKCVPTEEQPPVNDSQNEHGPYQQFKFICGLCREEYFDLESLEIHFKIHTSENLKTFHGQRIVESKESITTTGCGVKRNERNFQCEKCGVKFKRKDTLTNHFRIHTGERPYMCKICGFTFKQRGDCLKHERNHSKENDEQIL